MANDESERKQWARRRLIGVTALALLTVVALPMIFESKPRSLTDDVELVIPGRETPFIPAPATSALPPDPTAPTSTAPVVGAPVAASAVAVTTPVSAVPLAVPVTTPAVSSVKPAPNAVTAPIPAKAAAPVPVAGKSVTPATEPTGTSAHAYFLQLGIFASEANARKQAEKGVKAGFKVSVSEGEGKYRVRVGPYSDRTRALAVQRDMQKRGLNTVLVGP